MPVSYDGKMANYKLPADFRFRLSQYGDIV